MRQNISFSYSAEYENDSETMNYKNDNHQNGFVQNIVIIAVLLAMVFLSQQSFAKPTAQKIISQISEKTKEYSQKAGDWLKAKTNPYIAKEVQNGGERVKEEVIKQKNNLLQNIWENLKKYFAQKFSKTFGTEVK